MPTLPVVLLLVVAQQNWPQNWLKKPVAVQKWWSAGMSEKMKKTIGNLPKIAEMAPKKWPGKSWIAGRSLERHKVIDSAQAWQLLLSCICKLNGCHAISCHDFHGQCILQATTQRFMANLHISEIHPRYRRCCIKYPANVKSLHIQRLFLAASTSSEPQLSQ